MGERLTTKQVYDRARYARLKAERDAAKAPDRITQLSITERAYLAGLIDGEGSIFAASVGSGAKGRGTFHPIVCIAMTHRPVIDWVAARLGAGAVQLHNQTNLRRHPHYLPQWRVQLTGKRAQILCQILLPHMIVKREQAELVAGYPVDARSGPGRGLTSEIRQERERIRAELSRLNRPGGRDLDGRTWDEFPVAT